MKFFISIFLIFLSFQVAAEDVSKFNEQKIKNKVTAWMKKNNIPGVALEIYANGEPHSYYFGLADQENKIPVTNQTIFEVGSFTKLFTNLLLAEEVAAGNISLDDSIADYIPDLAISSDYLSRVTLLNLATHTSGLPFSVNKETKTRSQLPEYFANWVPSSPIGEFWGYSNINSGLLGYVLESVTHENINQLYRDRLLRPLGMALIGIDVPKSAEKYYAKGYTEENQVEKREKTWLFPSAGAMKASGDDMLIFLKASLQLPGIPPKISDAMRATQTAYVKTDAMLQGLGWDIHPITSEQFSLLLKPTFQSSFGPDKVTKLDKFFDGNALIDKTGATDGFRSYIAVIPARKSGIVILTNRYISNGEIVKMGREILFDFS